MAEIPGVNGNHEVSLNIKDSDANHNPPPPSSATKQGSTSSFSFPFVQKVIDFPYTFRFFLISYFIYPATRNIHRVLNQGTVYERELKFESNVMLNCVLFDIVNRRGVGHVLLDIRWLCCGGGQF